MKRSLVLLAYLAGGNLAAQAPIPSVHIVSPGENTYVSGPTLLQVAVDPPRDVGRIRQVTFFADGRMVCQVTGPPFECAWDAGAEVVEHQIRVVAQLDVGQRVVKTVRTKGAAYAESVRVDAVQVTATVTDGSGRFVKGLTRDDFRVLEDGIPQAITAFAAENAPVDLVLAIDTSSSMTPAMPKVKAAVRGLLNTLPVTYKVTLLGFNHIVCTLARRESETAERSQTVEKLAAGGGTALYDGIATAIDMLGRESGRKSLVVFTDGDDRNSHVSLQALEERLEQTDATIYMVGQGRGVREPALRKLIDHVARTSGGRAFHTDDIGELQRAFGEIAEELANQYLIGYSPPNSESLGKWRRIEVEVTRRGCKVRARRGYRLATLPR